MTLKTSIDLDGVLCDFNQAYLDRFGVTTDSEITKNVQTVLKKDKEFWLNLPVINHLDWQPKQYTTARIIPKSWIKEYLAKEMFPKAPVYQVPGYGLSKYSRIKAGGCQLHIDDSLHIFIDLNMKGIPCLLLNTPENQNYTEAVGRIYSLDKDEIEESYHLFKDTIFPHFKEFIQCVYN
jgi:hypothetical protein